MKHFKALLATVAIAAVATPLAHAATVTGDSSARIITPLNITAGNAGLRFGDIVPDASAAGTVAIAASNGAETCTTVVCLTSDRGAAAFNVTGEAGKSFTVSVPSSVTLNGTEASNTGQSMSSTLASSSATATLDAGGAAAFNVGGTLTVTANQAVGAYSGSFVVTVDYQ